MNVQPRWFTLILAFAALNIGGVVVTSAWRLASGTAAAQEDNSGHQVPATAQTSTPQAFSLPTSGDVPPTLPPESADLPPESADLPPGETGELPPLTDTTPEKRGGVDVPSPQVGRHVLQPDELELPGQLPISEIENPAIMQAIQESVESFPDLLSDPPSIAKELGSRQHNESKLRAQLENTQHLTEAAIGLLTMAAEAKEQGREEEHLRLLQMADNLRKMAAELLGSHP